MRNQWRRGATTEGSRGLQYVLAPKARPDTSLGQRPISANLFRKIFSLALSVFAVILVALSQFVASLESFLSAKVVVELLE